MKSHRHGLRLWRTQCSVRVEYVRGLPKCIAYMCVCVCVCRTYTYTYYCCASVRYTVVLLTYRDLQNHVQVQLYMRGFRACYISNITTHRRRNFNFLCPLHVRVLCTYYLDITTSRKDVITTNQFITYVM